MALYKISSSRVNNINADQYTGSVVEEGLIWYDPNTGVLRLYNGEQGGKIIGGGGSGSNISVANANVQVTNAVSSFNFTGSGITATGAGANVTITVPGAGYITFDGGSPTNAYVGGPAFDCGGVN